jgi:hypothetical protein
MSVDSRLGSKEWFADLANGLANAGLLAVTNALTPRRTAAATQTDPAKSSGGFSLSGLKWLPYAIAGVIVLIFVLVIRKK